MIISTASTELASQVNQFEQLTRNADAIVAIEVAFVPYGDLVLVGDVLRGKMIPLPSASALLGTCLPGKAAVRELAERAGNTPQAAVYEEAIERSSYSAIVFIEHVGQSSRVICDDGMHVTQNWDIDPRYPAWRERLDAILNNIH